MKIATHYETPSKLENFLNLPFHYQHINDLSKFKFFIQTKESIFLFSHDDSHLLRLAIVIMLFRLVVIKPDKANGILT